ncbi:MAG: helix-turn-helix transcriptional regulator [Candidatus Glassbacteria bacterium]|nr:helix-turn-helix transcriptional regulator [Candidatus Glassbacteria bacterium]
MAFELVYTLWIRSLLLDKENRKQFAERLSQAIKEVGGVVRAADLTGVKDRTIRKWLHAESDPDREYVVRIAKAAGYSIAWLAAGEGDKSGDAMTRLEHGIMEVPELDIELSAGDGSIKDAENIIGVRPFRESDIRAITNNPDNLVMVKVRGESMHPTFYPGDEVLVDMSAPVPIDDGIYAIRQDHTLKIKRIQHFQGGRIKIISDNPAYESILLALDEAVDFALIGRVIWGARRY